MGQILSVLRAPVKYLLPGANEHPLIPESDPVEWSDYPEGMLTGDSPEAFALNLRTLMRHARDNDRAELSSPETLEAVCGVSRPTLYRYLAREQSPTLEKLDMIAHAFGLRAWQLLVPRLDPDNPPHLPTEAELQLYERLKTVAAAFKGVPLDEQEDPPARDARPHRPPTGAGRRK